ncbi:MAG: MBL fold metallo-hydrolase [Halobacteria archaeon]|nr:MBL fold metallo-hydrolase [Halobacteria archaeon]
MEITNLTRDSEAFTSNVFLVEGDTNVLVDVGTVPGIIDEVREAGGIDAVVLTHSHRDHVELLPRVKQEFDVDVWGYDGSFEATDHEIDDGDTVEIGDETFEVLFTPGHKTDHVCLVGETVVFAGDLIFDGGAFGRTDLEEGNREALIESIQRLLEVVEDKDVEVIYTGHGSAIRGDVEGAVRMSLENARQL